MKTVLPFTCEEPVKVFRDGEWHYYACRHCKACLLRQSEFNTLRCDLESLSNKYCFFVTLTYSNSSVPVVCPRIEDDGGVFLELHNKRLNDNENVYKLSSTVDRTCSIGKKKFPLYVFYNENIRADYDFKSLIKRTKFHRHIPVLCKYDVVTFMKRLRVNIHRLNEKLNGKNLKDEKLRYYIVGEYGPKTLRPHYHVLFFTNSDFVSEILRQVLCSSWPYGRVDFQVSKGKASDYVAGYVNASCVISSFHKFESFRPFCLHSRYFGEQDIRKTIPEVYASSFEDLISKRFILHEQAVTVSLWRSIQSYYFPKCLGFSKLDYGAIYNLYTCYERVSRQFEEDSPAELARCLLNELPFYDRNHDRLEYCFDFVDLFLQITNYERKLDDNLVRCQHDWIDDPFIDEMGTIYGQLYRILYVSKRFVVDICDSNPVYYRGRLQRIIDWYKFVDLRCLNDQYKKQESFAVCYFGNDSDFFEYFAYFYDNYKYSDMKDTRLYRMFCNDNDAAIQRKIKHKELNDELGYFINSKKL